MTQDASMRAAEDVYLATPIRSIDPRYEAITETTERNWRADVAARKFIRDRREAQRYMDVL